jgi:hypothetical protein
MQTDRLIKALVVMVAVLLLLNAIYSFSLGSARAQKEES